jgi:hypothetical protein
MSCEGAKTCSDCLANQWNLPANKINFGEDNCQWCPEASTCMTMSNQTSCSGSTMINFANGICPELNCPLDRIFHSPYICSPYGIAILCLTTFIILLTIFTAFSWYRSSKAKILRRKLNSGARGDYKRCRECGETSQSQNFMCKECNRNERFDGTTIAGSLTSVAGIWFTLVVPQLAPLVILAGGVAVSLFVFVFYLGRNTPSEEDRLLSSQYLIVEEDVEANEKLTFGLDNITTSHLRYGIAKEISRENQAVNFVLETTLGLDIAVSLSRVMFGFYIWISIGLLLLVITSPWTYITQTILPIAVLLPSLVLATPMRNRKQAIVVTSKYIIIAQQATRSVRISSVKFTDVKEIKIRKTEGDNTGTVYILQNDQTRQTIYQLASVADFEAALVHAQFDGKLKEPERRLARNCFTKNYMTIYLGMALLFSVGCGGWMFVDFFRFGFDWIKLWAGIGLLSMSGAFFAMRNLLKLANPFFQDNFIYTPRVQL